MPLSIKQRTPGGNYILRGTIAGVRVYKSTGTSVRAVADAIRIRTEKEILDAKIYGKKKTISFAAAALTYIESGGEVRFLEPILRHFGEDTKLTDIDNAAVNAAAAAIYPKAAPATINRQLIVPISAIVHLAAEDDFCPPRKFRRRKVTARKTRWLTPDEFHKLSHHAAPHLVPILHFMIGTGARVRETLTLQASTLYLDTGEAYLTNTKNGHPRMVRFPAPTARALMAMKRPDAGTVFLSGAGRPYRINKGTGGQIKRGFDSARIAAGLGPEVTPHTLRHTWATWFCSQTQDFGKLLDFGGWGDPSTANIYRKIAPESLPDDLLRAGWDFRSRSQIAAQATPKLRIID